MESQDTQKATKIPKRAFTKPSIAAVVIFILIVFLLVPSTLPLFTNKASAQLLVVTFFSPFLVIPGLPCSYYSGLALAKIIRHKTGGGLLASFSAMLVSHIVCIAICIGIEVVIAGYPFQMCFDVCQKVEMPAAMAAYSLFSTLLFLPAYYALFRYAAWTRKSAGSEKVGLLVKERGLKLALIIMSAVAICGIGLGICERIDLNNKMAVIAEYERRTSNLQGQPTNEDAEVGKPISEMGDNNESASNSSVSGNDINPIIQNQDPGILERVSFVSVGNTRIRVVLEKGDLFGCYLESDEDRDGRWDVKECDLGDLGGKIYKVASFGSTQEYDPYIGFIMTDGTVKYFSFYDVMNDGSYSIKKLDLDGKVVDIVKITSGRNGTVGGYITNVFVLKDGSVVRFDESMVK